MDKNNTHIDDDFLKNLVNLPEDEKLPEDFTQKIMDKLPQPTVKASQQESKSWFSFRNAALVVVAFAVVIYVLLSFDVSGLFNLASDSSSQNPQYYLNMVTSVIEIFRQGFSGIEVTSISATAIITLVSLFLFDRLLKGIAGRSNASAA